MNSLETKVELPMPLQILISRIIRSFFKGFPLFLALPFGETINLMIGLKWRFFSCTEKQRPRWPRGQPSVIHSPASDWRHQEPNFLIIIDCLLSIGAAVWLSDSRLLNSIKWTFEPSAFAHMIKYFLQHFFCFLLIEILVYVPACLLRFCEPFDSGKTF